MTIGVLGLGQIGRSLVACLDSVQDTGLRVSAAFSRSVLVESQPAPLSWRLCTSLSEFLQQPYAVLVECASHEAVRTVIPDALTLQHDVVISSSGALADDALRMRVLTLAQRHDRHVYLSAGALGSLEILAVLREKGIHSVHLTSRKPPASIPGYEHLREPKVLFSGTAREASAAFPRHLNIAAAVGLLGIGLDQTRATLRVEPGLVRTCHEIEVRAARGRYRVSFEVEPAADNPQKTAVTADSIVTLLRSIQGGSSSRLAEVALPS
ncbi:MAG: aspartate dehydrogenase domain-containing protein [Clostridia bacterium]